MLLITKGLYKEAILKLLLLIYHFILIIHQMEDLHLPIMKFLHLKLIALQAWNFQILEYHIQLVFMTINHKSFFFCIKNRMVQYKIRNYHIINNLLITRLFSNLEFLYLQSIFFILLIIQILIWLRHLIFSPLIMPS